MQPFNRLLAVTLMMCVSVIAATAQTQLIDNVQLIDRSNSKSVTLSKPSGITSGQILNFPTAVGSANQVLTISSVSGSTANLGWTTPSSSSSTTSKRSTTDETTTAAGTATGLVVSATANKNYRITGVITGNRASTDDRFVVVVSGPANTSKVALALRCFNCPANTTGVPAYKSASATSLTSDVIDPAGSGTTNVNTFAYGIDGLIKLGSTGGDVTLYLDDGGYGSSDVVLKADSYILLTEIE